jgi:hypothetical protein
MRRKLIAIDRNKSLRPKRQLRTAELLLLTPEHQRPIRICPRMQTPDPRHYDHYEFHHERGAHPAWEWLTRAIIGIWVALAVALLWANL